MKERVMGHPSRHAVERGGRSESWVWGAAWGPSGLLEREHCIMLLGHTRRRCWSGVHPPPPPACPPLAARLRSRVTGARELINSTSGTFTGAHDFLFSCMPALTQHKMLNAQTTKAVSVSPGAAAGGTSPPLL